MTEANPEKKEIEVKHAPASRGTVAQGMSAHDWDPIRSLRSQFDRMMSELDWPDFRFGLPRRVGEIARNWPDFNAAIPPVDLVEHNGSYELSAELPGMSNDQIELKISDGMMTIKGEKSAERIEDEDDYHLHERSYGAFQRSFRIPVGVEADKAEAKLENGVLKVILPKSAMAMQKERKIEVKAG